MVGLGEGAAGIRVRGTAAALSSTASVLECATSHTSGSIPVSCAMRLRLSALYARFASAAAALSKTASHTEHAVSRICPRAPAPLSARAPPCPGLGRPWSHFRRQGPSVWGAIFAGRGGVCGGFEGARIILRLAIRCHEGRGAGVPGARWPPPRRSPRGACRPLPGCRELRTNRPGPARTGSAPGGDRGERGGGVERDVERWRETEKTQERARARERERDRERERERERARERETERKGKRERERTRLVV